MGCFLSSGKSSKSKGSTRIGIDDGVNRNPCGHVRKENAADEIDGEETGSRNISAVTFNLQELLAATDKFSPERYLGEGGFGKVYKGYLVTMNKEVAIKQLNLDGLQGAREFLAEVMTLIYADHPNLVKFIGYCVAEDQRLIVYEYMPLGSLDRHLFDRTPDMPILNWCTRLKIAAGAARGLEYLHEKMNPPTIYRDLKCSNILLGEGYHPKLSDLGFAKVGPLGDNTHVSTRVMGTCGYCAPEYAMTGHLTFESDIYSLGVVLLELITGRKVIDSKRPRKERSLIEWARPLLKNRNNFNLMLDPQLEGQCSKISLFQAIAVAAMCIQAEPTTRPSIGDLVLALDHLAKTANQ